MPIIRYLTVGSDATSPVERVALTSLLLFALLVYLAPHAAMAAGLAMLAVTFVRPRAAIRDCTRDPVLIVFVILSVYVLARAGFAAAEFPALTQDQWEQGIRAGTPVLLLPIAWWLRGDLARVFAFLAVALGAFCLDMLIEFDWHRADRLLFTPLRSGINGPGLLTALIAGTGMIGLIAFGPRILQRMTAMGTAARVLIALLWLMAMSLLLIAQWVTLTRSVILCLTVLIPVLVILLWWPHRNRRFRGGSRLLLGAALLVLAGFSTVAYDHISRRLSGVTEIIGHTVAGNLDKVPTDSFGIRIHLVRYGAELISERPLFGWGPGTRAVRSIAEQRDRLLFTNYGDLHNEWVQMTFWFGFVGLLLYGTLLFLLFRAGIRSYRAGVMPRDMFLFLATSMVLLAGWTVINSRLLDLDFQYYLILMLGTMYTFHLKLVGRQPPDPPPTSTP